jgi:hypothetical protein
MSRVRDKGEVMLEFVEAEIWALSASLQRIAGHKG